MSEKIPFELGASATEPDWAREKCRLLRWWPERHVLRAIRRYQAVAHWPFILRKPVQLKCIIAHRFWSTIAGCDIPLNVNIAGGLLMPHPNGIVIHPQAVIGPNCLLFQQVTIGHSGDGFPVIGGHVDIGAGAKILGPITIGDHVRIGANAVVISDIPSNCDAVGIPARIIHRNGK